MILGHSLQSHMQPVNSGINSHISESLFMTKSLLDTCTSLDIAGVCLSLSLISQEHQSLPFDLSTNLMKE